MYAVNMTYDIIYHNYHIALLTSSPKPDFTQFTQIENRKKQQIIVLMKLESANFEHF